MDKCFTPRQSQEKRGFFDCQKMEIWDILKIMTEKEAKKRIEKLKKTINHCRYSYHVLDKSLISDAALDSLKKELFDLERKFPQFITPDSPTQRVGGKPLEKFQKVRRASPMLSFNDAFSREDMTDWLERVGKIFGEPSGFYCELKIDGLAIELEYENRIFKTGSTRGDGVIGEDVTQNLRTIEAIPLKIETSDSEIKLPKRFIARGEVFMTKKEFERLNKEQKAKGASVYANPRNVAAGSVRQLDPKITASRRLDSFAYDIVADIGQKTHEEEHKILKALGFKTNSNNKFCRDLKEVFEFRDYWEKHREKLPYEIDGIVVIVNSNKDFEKAGVAGKAPRAAIAYKFSPREATTIVEDIKVYVGRTGALTPVAYLKPVEVGGVVISRASLHNEDEIRRLGLKIGDTVIVNRAGDVIPQISKVLKDLRTGKEREFRMPRRCPVCAAPVKKAKDEAIWRCSNKFCFAQNREKLYHFVSRPAFDMAGIGPKILDKFIEKGLISDAADLFNLKEGDIAALERFGEKSARNIVGMAEARKLVDLSRFLYALGIRHIGEENSVVLANKFSKVKKDIGRPAELAAAAKKLTLEELETVQDFGPKVSRSVYEWFRDSRNLRFLEKLDKVGARIKSARLVAGAKLKGKTFVLTGGLGILTRDEAKRKIRESGGEVSSSVSKNTDYAVAGSEPGSKYERAKELGIKIISEQEFLKMIK